MTDTVTAPSAPPPIVETLVHDFAQKGLTTLAASLGTAGFFSGDQSTQFVAGGVAIAMFAVSCVWTYAAAKFRRTRLAAAIAAPAVPSGK